MTLAGLLALLKAIGPFLPSLLAIVGSLLGLDETPEARREKEVGNAIERGRRGLGDLERIVRERTTGLSNRRR